MKIFKYPIPIEDYFELELPTGSKILTVQTQYNQPCIWCLVYPDIVPIEKRKFRLVGTGHLMEEGLVSLIYIGTFQLNDGILIFHLFELV